VCHGWVSLWEERLKVYDIETREIFVSRDVIFPEDIYPFASNDKEQVIENIEQSGRSVYNECFGNTRSPVVEMPRQTNSLVAEETEPPHILVDQATQAIVEPVTIDEAQTGPKNNDSPTEDIGPWDRETQIQRALKHL